MSTHAARALPDVPDQLLVLRGRARALRLRAPKFKRPTVERKRLLAILAAHREQRVVLISAPAGFGKTVLAAQLIDSDPRPSCWLALEEGDNDPVVLSGDVLDVLGALRPITARISKELQSPHPRISKVVLPLLSEQLSDSEPFILVLDDVGLVKQPDSLAILSCLVDHAPPGSQVVLVTRSEAEISVARLRAAGEVIDLETEDLAFDVSETRDLLTASGVDANDEQVDEILDRTEGWAAGIALAILPRTGQVLEAGHAVTPIAARDEVAAYLIEEAVESQSPQVRSFLLASSLLRRMSASLCDAALQIANSAEILASLERDSLFVDRLNKDGEWYRYHQLFHELLEAEIRRREPDKIPQVLSRAAAWHESHGDVREAFEYAHRGGDLRRAGRILLHSAEDLIARGQIETVSSWVARCTPEEMNSDPQLALAGAWLALLSGEAVEAWRLAAVANTAGDLDVASSDGATSLRSSLANLRATLGSDGMTQMLRDGQFVVAVERDAGTRWVMDGWRAVGAAHLLDGRAEEAIAAYGQALLLASGRPELNFITINCLGYSALAAADIGDWRRARKWARQAHALSTHSGLQDVIQSVAPYTARATVLVHDGLLPQARQEVAHVLELLPTLRALRWFEADISLRCADLSLDLGETQCALELADRARVAISHYPDPGRLPERLTALDARLRNGDELELTPSELRLVPFLSSHLSLQEIGDRIYLSRATVKTHTDSIYRKLDVSSRSAAVERLETLGVGRRLPAELLAPAA